MLCVCLLGLLARKLELSFPRKIDGGSRAWPSPLVVSRLMITRDDVECRVLKTHTHERAQRQEQTYNSIGSYGSAVSTLHRSQQLIRRAGAEMTDRHKSCQEVGAARVSHSSACARFNCLIVWDDEHTNDCLIRAQSSEWAVEHAKKVTTIISGRQNALRDLD